MSPTLANHLEWTLSKQMTFPTVTIHYLTWLNKFRIWRRWKDKRLVEGDQNKHRETDCPTNDIIDWGVYAPEDLQIVQTKAKVFDHKRSQRGQRLYRMTSSFRNPEIGQASNFTPPEEGCLNLCTDLMSR